jgi:environmental stress-induced protein Ves
MTLQRFDIDGLTASPWKNGGGVTREIASYPAGAGMNDFLWRLSIATVAMDGPFSIFPGVDRIITLLEGPGMRLVSEDGGIDHRFDQPLDPYAFPGEEIVQGIVLGGASSDFNVMTRRRDMRAFVGVERRPHTTANAAHGLLLAVAGGWRVRDEHGGQDHALEPRQGLWWADEPHAWTLMPGSPDDRLLAVRILSTTTQLESAP